jgi:tetratricopeptide (TPR) repeat protein
MVWYQTGPYFAYYYGQRYQDVIDLANATLKAVNEPVLEESYYWRGQAKIALGDQKGGVFDLRRAIEVHPGFGPAIAALQQIGEKP